MIKSIQVMVACAVVACAPATGEGEAFHAWQAYELRTEKPLPPDYHLEGNEENCLPAPRSECVYRNGNLSLGFHDGILINKSVDIAGALPPDPFIERLAAAGSRSRVIAVLEERMQDYPPTCSLVEGSQVCGLLIKTNPSEYFEARFSGDWRLISLSLTAPDAI